VNRLAYIGMGLVTTALPLLAFCGGCTESSASLSTSAGQWETSYQWQQDRFTYAIDNLNRLEDFDLLPPPSADVEPNPLFASCPQSDMLTQIVEWLNQWMRTQQQSPQWSADPMLGSLPASLRELPMVQDLGKMEFTAYDGFALREATWLQSLSKWVCGNELDDLARAKQLFDWTIRNIQLQNEKAEPGSDEPAWIPQLPWETLLLGNGTAVERAWVFILLARQQGLDAALLALADPDDPSGKPLRPWEVAVLVDKKLYLFDQTLGLPIAAGIKLDADGQLVVEPATLEQVAGDGQLLRQMDADAEHPYPVKAEDLKHLVALVEASPAYLSARMKMTESRLVGEQTMVLSTAPSAVAAKFKAAPQIAEVRLWTHPYEVLYRRLRLTPKEITRKKTDFWPFMPGIEAPLYKARLYYFKGQLTGQNSATWYYQASRTSEKKLAEMEDAQQNDYYQQNLPLIRTLQEQDRKAGLERLKAFAISLADQQKQILQWAKQDASYWLGLLNFERGKYPTAIDYLAKRTVEAVPNSPWAHGAIYNLGRCYEASGEPEVAIKLYTADTESPAFAGNLLRAKWLQMLIQKEKQP
jgi:hypothetical protein